MARSNDPKDPNDERRDPDLPVFRPDRPGIRKVLGDLEADIMEVVWDRPADQGVTVRDVFEVLYERRRLAYTTVMSTMARLAKKRLLRVDKIEHAYIYYPAVSEEQLVSHFVGRILDDLVVNFSGVTFERLARMTEPDAAERIERLSSDIQSRRERRRGGGPGKASHAPDAEKPHAGQRDATTDGEERG